VPRLINFVRRKPFQSGQALYGGTAALKRHIHCNGSFRSAQVRAIHTPIGGGAGQMYDFPINLAIIFQIQLQDSAAARRFFAACDFCERPCIGGDGFRNGLAVYELPFAAAFDQPGFAQNFEVV
jgi:hypothetical protein